MLALGTALPACAVDGYLTCGEKCIDGSTVPDVGAPDATIPVDGSSDVRPGDGQGDACSLLSNGQKCAKSGECCSKACNSYEECVSTCTPLATACSAQQDTCCIGGFCSSGMCVMCLANGIACAQDNQCCSTKCQAFGEAGKVCVND